MWQGRGDVAGERDVAWEGGCGRRGEMWQGRGMCQGRGGCDRGGGMWQGRGNVKGEGGYGKGRGMWQGGKLTNNHCTQGQKFVITVF